MGCRKPAVSPHFIDTSSDFFTLHCRKSSLQNQTGCFRAPMVSRQRTSAEEKNDACEPAAFSLRFPRASPCQNSACAVSLSPEQCALQPWHRRPCAAGLPCRSELARGSPGPSKSLIRVERLCECYFTQRPGKCVLDRERDREHRRRSSSVRGSRRFQRRRQTRPCGDKYRLQYLRPHHLARQRGWHVPSAAFHDEPGRTVLRGRGRFQRRREA